MASRTDGQEKIDRSRLSAIENRALQRAAAEQDVDPETDRQMARADAHDLRCIRDPAWQEGAAVRMADNMRAYRGYKTGLDDVAPGELGMAAKINALDAAATKKMWAKDIFIDTATPEGAAPPSGRDSVRASDGDTGRATRLEKADEAVPPQPTSRGKSAADNQIESDEVFTARQREIKPAGPPEIEQQYLRVGDKFSHPKNINLVAFDDKGNKLETRDSSENIAESMVRIAHARGWDDIKVAGSERFRKEAWREAAVRGMRVKGYTPTEQDKATLAWRAPESEADRIGTNSKPLRVRDHHTDEAGHDRANNRMAESFAQDSDVDAVKKYSALAGAVVALAAMNRKAEADGLDPAQRAIVSARLRRNVVNSIERGAIPDVRLKQEIDPKRAPAKEQEHAR